MPPPPSASGIAPAPAPARPRLSPGPLAAWIVGPHGADDAYTAFLRLAVTLAGLLLRREPGG